MPEEINLLTMDDRTGFMISGRGVESQFGRIAASAGDVNGDGIEDIVAGAPGSAGGSAYVVFGQKRGLKTR